MVKKYLISLAVCMLLSGLAVASETAAEGAVAGEGAEGAAKHGLSLNDGAVLIVLGVAISMAALAVIYLVLSKRKA